MARLLPAATALVILGASILPFLTPAWVGFEQGRAQAATWTGYDATTLRTATNQILADLVTGGDFGVTVDGSPVLTAAERSHMRDVRGVFAGFAVVVIASAGLLVVAARRARGPDARRALWQRIRRGAVGLAVVIGVVGAISVVAFDAAFELFHRLFFASGTYSFDPATSRLIQLFPDQFWSETTLAIGAVGLVVAVGVARLAGRRMLGSLVPDPAPALAPSGATR